MFVQNQTDIKWFNALKEIGAKINPGRLVVHVKDGNVIDAHKTLEKFFEHFGLEESIHEKFIENKNLEILLCGCIKGPSKNLLHLCAHHGPCSLRTDAPGDGLREAMRHIIEVASGERQVASDDTEGMAYIDKYAREALAALT